MSDLTHSFTVDATPREAFEAILDVRSWWGATNIVGPTDQVGADWFYLVPDIHYSKQRTVELVADERVVWEFTDGYLDFIADKGEWIGTTGRFEIGRRPDQGDLQPRWYRLDGRVLRRLLRRLAALHHHKPASTDPDRPRHDAQHRGGPSGRQATRRDTPVSDS